MYFPVRKQCDKVCLSFRAKYDVFVCVGQQLLTVLPIQKINDTLHIFVIVNKITLSYSRKFFVIMY